mgnify:CR=1 FL=1
MKNVYLLVCMVLFVGCTSSDSIVVKPNLLVIMADSLSYVILGCMVRILFLPLPISISWHKKEFVLPMDILFHPIQSPVNML